MSNMKIFVSRLSCVIRKHTTNQRLPCVLTTTHDEPALCRVPVGGTRQTTSHVAELWPRRDGVAVAVNGRGGGGRWSGGSPCV